METVPRIALQIEKDRAHGRAIIEGIASYALERTDWRLELVGPRQLSPRSIASFDGLIVRVMDGRTENMLAASGKCVVDIYGRGDAPFLDTIRLDDDAIAEMAAGFFHEHRFDNVAYCGFPGLRFSDQRGQSFSQLARGKGCLCELYAARGMRIADTFFRNERTDEPADVSALGRWICGLRKPVAVFCCNDLRAYQVLRICREMHIDVPREMAVLGVDDDALLCTFTNPPLSSIDTDARSLGRMAAALLDRQMSKKGDVRVNLILHRPRRLVERASTEIYPYATPWLSDAIVFMRRHLADRVSAADVIAHLGYSHTTVGRAFAAEVGCSVQQKIIQLRFERACRLLKETRLSAAQIAAECGYPSAQYFSHLFVARMSTTPGRWRFSNLPGRGF